MMALIMMMMVTMMINIIYHDHCVLDKPGIWILGIRGVTGHVGDGETLGHIHTQVVSSWQRRYKLEHIMIIVMVMTTISS